MQAQGSPIKAALLAMAQKERPRRTRKTHIEQPAFFILIVIVMCQAVRVCRKQQVAAQGQQGARLVLTSAKSGQVSAPAHQFAFEPQDCLVFGPETRGLPQEILDLSPHRIRIPMIEGRVRSLNLSTSAGIVLYMALARTGLMEDWA